MILSNVYTNDPLPSLSALFSEGKQENSKDFIWPETNVTPVRTMSPLSWEIAIRPGTSIILQLEQEIRLLDQIYVFRNPSEVIGFLTANPFLIEFLHEIYSQIRNLFEKEELYLELICDPENGIKQLVVFIRVDDDLDGSIQRLNKLDEEWWLDALDAGQGLITINLAFS